MKLLVKSNECFRVFERHVLFVGGLIHPRFNKDEPVRVIGAGKKVVGDAALLGTRCSLRLRRTLENPVTSSGFESDVDYELVSYTKTFR